MSKSNFYAALSTVYEDFNKTLEETLKRAREIIGEAYRSIGITPDADGILDIGASFDGTWPKQGHDSLFGVGTVLTGLIVDSVVFSKYCLECVANAAVYGKDRYL